MFSLHISVFFLHWGPTRWCKTWLLQLRVRISVPVQPIQLILASSQCQIWSEVANVRTTMLDTANRITCRAECMAMTCTCLRWRAACCQTLLHTIAIGQTNPLPEFWPYPWPIVFSWRYSWTIGAKGSIADQLQSSSMIVGRLQAASRRFSMLGILIGVFCRRLGF
jgi:hypothetical protein